MVLGIYDNYADAIFHKLYNVRVPVIATYTEGELEILGIPLNIIDGSRRNSYAELVDVMLPISEMVEKHNSGFKITVKSDSDVLEIYDLIQKHLQTWKYHSTVSLNRSYVPDDDLIMMDKFASEIFNLNKINIVDSNVITKTGYDNDFGSILMSNNVKVEKEEIIYADVTRESEAPTVVRGPKYDLNSLLK